MQMGDVLANPTYVSATPGDFALAPRSVRDLRGKTVGLLNNTKYNSDTLLDALGGLLQAEHGVTELVRQPKPHFAKPVPDDVAKELAARCDVVVTAIGD
jgi:hypothetical protein